MAQHVYHDSLFDVAGWHALGMRAPCCMNFAVLIDDSDF